MFIHVVRFVSLLSLPTHVGGRYRGKVIGKKRGTYKAPRPSSSMTEILIRVFMWTFLSMKTGSRA